MFRCKGYEYQKIETIRKEISDMRIQLQKSSSLQGIILGKPQHHRFDLGIREWVASSDSFFCIYPPRLFLPSLISNLE